MSDEAKKALEQFLIALLDGLKDGATWAKEQVPLVLQEKLAFDFVWALACVVFFLLALFVCWRTIKWAITEDCPLDGDLVVPFAGLGCVFSLVGVVANSQTAFQIYFAPRLYLLEWAMALVK